MKATADNRAATRLSRIGWWGRAIAGSLGLVGGATAAEVPGTGSPTYRSSEAAPMEWRVFAAKLQTLLHDCLASDDEKTLQFRRHLEESAKAEAQPNFFTARVWAAPDGVIERLELEGGDEALAAELQGLFAGQKVGASAPADMLQPLRIKFSLEHAR
ncbi:MAG: hypothetical protein IKE42_26925 [Aquamicrobium sp.]|jgi:hypothetical protein|uniref:hypothetical protein n=1 Tax=Mesorhizobium sp. Pch-S TaxID=2082387 RepID=UPI001010F349|nr:hypothetical protein [Mesorhizobium sp. Pch-S]MBR2691503.1 hypothetical protein [Aquamicrobium sp.]